MEPPRQRRRSALLHQSLSGPVTARKPVGFYTCNRNIKWGKHSSSDVDCFSLFQQTLNMTLDHKCQIFLTLNGAAGEGFTLWSHALKKSASFQISIVMAPVFLACIHNLAFGSIFKQTRSCSSLERTACEFGTQPTTLCRWSSMATETPKWVKGLFGQGRCMPLWHIREIFWTNPLLTLYSERIHLNAPAPTHSTG